MSNIRNLIPMVTYSSYIAYKKGTFQEYLDYLDQMLHVLFYSFCETYECYYYPIPDSDSSCSEAACHLEKFLEQSYIDLQKYRQCDYRCDYLLMPVAYNLVVRIPANSSIYSGGGWRHPEQTIFLNSSKSEAYVNEEGDAFLNPCALEHFIIHVVAYRVALRKINLLGYAHIQPLFNLNPLEQIITTYGIKWNH